MPMQDVLVSFDHDGVHVGHEISDHRVQATRYQTSN